MTNIYLCLTILLGYIIGSIPWALIIGKVFYNTDVRKHGSGNLGGTNVLRTLGVVPGVSVMALDALKALLYMIVLYFIGLDYCLSYAGLAVCIGHCFPIFAGFKGGKAVACSAGYSFGLSLMIENQFVYCWLIPMAIFLTVLFTTKYMSLSSITLEIMFGITSIIFYSNKLNSYLVILLGIFVIYMHRANIKRLLTGTESKLGKKK